MSNVGFRIYTKINRPDPALISKFREIPVANLADNMGRISCVAPEIKPYNDTILLGCAFTVRAPLGDNLMFHKAIDMAKPGDIIVVDGQGGIERSLCGEIMFSHAMSRGIGGFLVDGSIRDTDALKKLPFPVFARGVTPNGPYKNGPGEINVPVSIGGQVVFPGDIILGDSDGVVVIRAEDAEDMLEKGLAHNRREQVMFRQIKDGTFDRSWVDKALTENGCEIID